MRHIVLESNLDGTVVFDIAELESRFAQLEDNRAARGKVYPLPLLVVLIILAKLAGQDKPSGIASWLRERKEQLWQLFDWRHQRMPCLNTIRTTMSQVVDVTLVEQILQEYLHETYGGFTSELVALDGKTMRGTIPKGMTQGVHLLAAYLPEEGVVIKQVRVDTKENEITAAPDLIETIAMKGRVVCADAMQTQRRLSTDINNRGGDYLWIVKNNQKILRNDVMQFFKPARRSSGWYISPLPHTSREQIDKGHGRIETRTVTLMSDTEGFLDWPGVSQVFMLERTFYEVRSQRQTKEVSYGITSCSPERANAKQILQWVRQYWGIENGLHYRRDVTLLEDATRMSEPDMAQMIATVNNFIIGLTQKLGFTNLAEARRIFDFQINRQLCALC